MWTEIKEFPNCFVSKEGDVLGVSGITLKPIYDKDGYTKVSLRHANGKLYSKRIHILVAEAFIDNPDSKPVVNHKNGVKDDNHVDNLEWATVAENALHAFRELGLEHPNNSPVEIHRRDEIVGVFKNNKDAQESLKVNGVTFTKYRNQGLLLYGELKIVEVDSVDDEHSCYNAEIIKESDGTVLNSRPLKCSNGKVYKSIEETAKDLGIGATTVARYLKSGKPYKNMNLMRITPYEYMQHQQ